MNILHYKIYIIINYWYILNYIKYNIYMYSNSAKSNISSGTSVIQLYEISLHIQF